ncbi:S41 family peptidase [Oceanicaulis sp. LC35]|uniref:S41 family peptidase n=1 Tax=Oceanicaulis sp. LC35 TaxID=3349635 RepID=UPI003F86C153
MVLLLAFLFALFNGAASSEPIFNEDGTLAPQAEGVWYSREKGWILDINDTGITRWQDTPQGCYANPAPDDSTPLMGQLEYRLFRASHDGQSLSLNYLPGDASAHFERLDALPPRCGSDDLTSETAIFDVFTSVMAQHYSFFDARGVDWDALVAHARPQVRDGMGEAALWEVLDGLLAPLGDSHTKMVGLVNGEPRRAQSGLGTTLPMIRDGMGEGAWLNGLVDQLFNEMLDPGAELIADRVIVGEITPESGQPIGYIQIFTMGGFTTEHTPGSIEWSQAELAALSDMLDDALTRFADHQAVILDLSNNRGGYDAVTRAIAARFTDQPFLGYRVSVPGAPEADQDYPITPYEGVRYTGPVYLMTSDVTVSGGEITTLMMRQLPNVIQVGSTTRGAFSTPLAKPLPNGWYLELSNEVFEDSEGHIFEGRGIPPVVAFDIYPEDNPITHHKTAIERVVGMIEAG